MSMSADIFADKNPVRYRHLLDLCGDPDKLQINLLKFSSLRDRSGMCESCNKEDIKKKKKKKKKTFYWKCGACA